MEDPVKYQQNISVRRKTRKVAINVRYDVKVLQAFRALGPGWQTKMNAVLLEWVESNSECSIQLDSTTQAKTNDNGASSGTTHVLYRSTS